MTPHQLVVRDLVRDGCLTTEFLAGLRMALCEHCPALSWFTLIPDAYDVSGQLVTVYEVEDTHRVDADKLRSYAKLWHQLDGFDWELRLVIIDIRGGRYEPDLAEVYYLRLPTPEPEPSLRS